jgi:hypothetical protein
VIGSTGWTGMMSTGSCPMPTSRNDRAYSWEACLMLMFGGGLVVASFSAGVLGGTGGHVHNGGFKLRA